jgi:hypothetical protein
MRWLGWAAVGGLLIAALAAPGAASSTDGNNGTVKIHEGATETEPIVRNEPHVCTFHLHFFFADPFDSGTWEIQEWSPGDKGTVVLTGTYDTNGDGEDRDPDAGVYELPDGHYKLFWDGDLDTLKHDKHKVFWVDCDEATAPPSFEQSPGGETDSPSMTPSVPPSFEQSPGGETDSPSMTPSVPPSFEQSPGGETDSPSTPPTEAPPSFGQSVGGVTDAPGGQVTQPPTDALPMSTPTDNGWRTMLIVLAALLASVLIVTPQTTATRRR